MFRRELNLLGRKKYLETDIYHALKISHVTKIKKGCRQNLHDFGLQNLGI
jgi:hypothetical protein